MMEPGPKVKRTRKRIPHSCQPCRRRKLKCDRQHPACQNCVKRGDEELCFYIEAPEDEKTRAMRARLEQLEAQVRAISSSLAVAEANEIDDDLEDTDTQFSKLRISPKDKAATAYYGPNCRFAVIAENADILKPKSMCKKTCELIKSRDAVLADEPLSTGFPFMRFSSAPDLAAMLPDGNLCDALITRYFSCSNALFNIIDSNSYWEEYPLLWSTNPPQYSLLALTFLMVACGARSLNEGNPLLSHYFPEGMPRALKLSNRWKQYGQMALSENNLFRTSNLRNIQATLLLCLLEDEDHVRWNLLGLLGNMARIAGLHRDPSKFQELDEKKRNLRRRLWSYIYILDQNEAVRYGCPPNIAEGTYDCEPIETPASAPSDPENTFMFWMFKLHKAISTSFPGPIGIHKNLSAVEKHDLKITELIEQLPPEFHLSENYTPLFGESGLQIIRRYTIACLIQGHLLTLHRPYASKSAFSKTAAANAARSLIIYQSQIMTLSSDLEPYAWFIEEFLDPDFVRAMILLAGNLVREPNNPLAPKFIVALKAYTAETKRKALRKRGFAKAHNLFERLLIVLTEKQKVINESRGEASHITGPSRQTTPAKEANDLGTGEILSESMFRWNEYMMDMILNTDENEYEIYNGNDS